MKLMRIMAVVATAMLWAGPAAGQMVTVDYQKGRDFSAYKTFMWMKQPTTENPLDRQRVVDEVNAVLTAKGLTLVTSDADVCVFANTATEQERTLNTFYDGFGGGWRWRGTGFGSATTTVTTYEVGTLIVDIFDSKLKEAVWRGVAMKTLSSRPAKNAEYLHKAVVKMFERFPPQVSSERD